MSDLEQLAAHLVVTWTDRGFAQLPAIESTYPGGSVRVYESSAASQPCIWLTAEAPSNLNEPHGPSERAPIHLAVDDAWRLAEQIVLLASEHYQTRYEREGPVVTAIAEAEACGYQRAIDALRAADAQSKEAAYVENRFDHDLYDGSYDTAVDFLEASAHTAIRSGESTDDDR